MLPRQLTLIVLPHLITPAAATYVADDTDISGACADWCADPTAAETTHGHVGTWDTSDVTNMEKLFYDCKTFNEDISAWNTGKVTSMHGLFWRTAFNQPLESWDVSNVKDMSRMFSDDAKFNQPLNGWTTTSLESTQAMFYYAETFNQPLDRWDTSALTSMNNMFECVKDFDQDLGWQVSANCSTSIAFFNTRCKSWDCGLNGATPPPTPKPTPVQTSGAAATAPLLFLGVAALLLSQ